VILAPGWIRLHLVKRGKLVALALVAVLTLTAQDCGPEDIIGKRRCTKENRFDRGDDCKAG
jgi:hypothetical protein